MVDISAAVQSQNVVSAYFISKHILPFGFAEQSGAGVRSDNSDVLVSTCHILAHFPLCFLLSTRRVLCSGADEEDEDDEEAEEKLPSCMDYVMHFLTIFWKVLFAFVPPTGEWIN